MIYGEIIMKKSPLLIVLFACLFTITSIPANAAIIEITATFDGRIQDVNGVSSGPTLLEDAYLEAYLGTGGYDTRIIMEFDVSGITASIASADIMLPTAVSVTSGNQINVFAYSGNGVLELADAFAGTDVGLFTATSSSANTVSLDTGVLQSLLDGGATHFGFMMRTVNPGQAYWSDTNSTQLMLNTTVVPVPAAVWLFGSGLIGLMSIARRKKA